MYPGNQNSCLSWYSLLRPRQFFHSSPNRFWGILNKNILLYTVCPQWHRLNQIQWQNQWCKLGNSIFSIISSWCGWFYKISEIIPLPHPQRYQIRIWTSPSGSPQVGVQSCLWSLQVSGLCFHCGCIPVAGGKYFHRTRMYYILPIPLLISYVAPPIKHHKGS